MMGHWPSLGQGVIAVLRPGESLLRAGDRSVSTEQTEERRIEKQMWWKFIQRDVTLAVKVRYNCSGVTSSKMCDSDKDKMM